MTMTGKYAVTSTANLHVQQQVIRTPHECMIVSVHWVMDWITRHLSRSSVVTARCVLLGFGLTLSLLPIISSAQQAKPMPNTEAVAGPPGKLGEPQLVEADVGADTALASISLFFRFAGERDFRQIPMQQTTTPGVYAASVPTEGITTDALEYYLFAEEKSGSTLFRGSAFSPLVRELLPAFAADDSADPLTANNAAIETESSPQTRSRKNWIWYGLGALAVGALIAANSDDGGNESAGNCSDGRCQLTITLPDP